MSIRNLLKGALTATVIALAPQTYQAHAEEARQEKQDYQTITLDKKKYHITPKKVILDEEENKVTNQNILRDVMFTYILNANFHDYEKQAKKNLKIFNRSRTATQLIALFEGYSTVLKEPVKKIIEDLKGKKPGSTLLTALALAEGLYEGVEETLVELHVGQDNYLFADMTSHTVPAEKDYKRFLALLKKDLTEHERAREAFECILESEHILRAAPASYKKIRKCKDLDADEEEKKEFTELLHQEDIEGLQKICDEIQSRARKSKEWKEYITKLTEEKAKSKAYKLKQRIKKDGLLKVFKST